LAFPSAAQTEAQHTYQQIVCKQFALADAHIPATVRQALNGQPKMQARDAQQRLWRGSSHGLLEIEPSGKKNVWTGKDGLPILALTGLALGPDGWLGGR
jgi:hypothetical protein